MTQMVELIDKESWSCYKQIPCIQEGERGNEHIKEIYGRYGSSPT